MCALKFRIQDLSVHVNFFGVRTSMITHAIHDGYPGQPAVLRCVTVQCSCMSWAAMLAMAGAGAARREARAQASRTHVLRTRRDTNNLRPPRPAGERERCAAGAVCVHASRSRACRRTRPARTVVTALLRVRALTSPVIPAVFSAPPRACTHGQTA